MKILLTGASSFTGYWIAKELSAAGHHVVAAMRGERTDYASDVKGRRVGALAGFAEPRWGLTFGDDAFIGLVSGEDFDVLCHHAALVGDYRAPDYDMLGATAANTRRFGEVARTMAGRGTRCCVITGSVFEADEGAGEAPLRAFSPYGLSKQLSAQIARFWCECIGLPLGKFVIPNPFGPMEDARFCAYLMRQWKAGQTAEVRTPDYLRDNIHVRLLALAYAGFVGELLAGRSLALHPSGYVETQGRFAQRFAAEMGPRLRLDAPVALARQSDFSEPLMRVNTQPAAQLVSVWEEAAAWDELAAFYAA